MPGSNHDIDATFMDNLPLAVRDAALDLIRFSSLKQMLEFRFNGLSEFHKNKFKLDEEQWQKTLNAVILTKVSYFDIQLHFPNRYIDKLIEIAAFASGQTSYDPIELYQYMLSEHPKFASWLKKAIQVKQQNLRVSRATIPQA
mgnify:CR=1 FL=1